LSLRQVLFVNIFVNSATGSLFPSGKGRFLMDRLDFLWRLTTDQDWKSARSLLDPLEEMHLQVALLFYGTAQAQYDLNAASIARSIRSKGIEVSDDTVRGWIAELRNHSR
jgi:hypothetical protein